MDFILACYICCLGFELLLEFEEYLIEKRENYKGCGYLACGLKCKCEKLHTTSSTVSINARANYLQSLISCFEQLKSFINLRKNLSKRQNSQWKNRLDEAKIRQVTFAEELTTLIHKSPNTPILFSDNEIENSNSGSIDIRQKATTAVLTNFALEEWYHLPRIAKKTNLLHTIRLWRILDICSQKESLCQNLLNSKLKQAEELRSAQKDFDKKIMGHFIRSKTKIVNEKVKSVQLLFRFWAWAVESARDNLFNSITLVERLLQQTSEKVSLKTLPKA